MLFYLCKVLFSDFLQFKVNFACVAHDASRLEQTIFEGNKVNLGTFYMSCIKKDEGEGSFTS